MGHGEMGLAAEHNYPKLSHLLKNLPSANSSTKSTVWDLPPNP